MIFYKTFRHLHFVDSLQRKVDDQRMEELRQLRRKLSLVKEILMSSILIQKRTRNKMIHLEKNLPTINHNDTEEYSSKGDCVDIGVNTEDESRTECVDIGVNTCDDDGVDDDVIAARDRFVEMLSKNWF